MNKKFLGFLEVVLLVFIICFGFVSSCESGQVDINSASKEDLIKITYIGEVRAQDIIDTRPFDSVDELINIKGIGNITLEKIKQQDLACVGGVENVKEDTNEPDKPKTVEPAEEIINDLNEDLEKNKTKSIINLNPYQDSNTYEIIYESKNEKIRKYSIYGFCVFLIFVIVILLIKK